MNNRHKVFKERNILKFVMYFVTYVILVAFIVWAFIYLVTGTVNSVKKVGLKNIVSEIWEGEKK